MGRKKNTKDQPFLERRAFNGRGTQIENFPVSITKLDSDQEGKVRGT